MRIIGHLPHPRLKITLMQHGRYLLKFEDVDAEIVFRCREDEGVDGLASAAHLLSTGLADHAEQILAQMREARRSLLQAQPEEEDDFPDLL